MRQTADQYAEQLYMVRDRIDRLRGRCLEPEETRTLIWLQRDEDQLHDAWIEAMYLEKQAEKEKDAAAKAKRDTRSDTETSTLPEVQVSLVLWTIKE